MLKKSLWFLIAFGWAGLAPLPAAVAVKETDNRVQVTWLYQNDRAQVVGLLLDTQSFKPEAAIPMTRGEAGRWSVTLDSRRGQEYRYKYLVDGKVTEDPDSEKGYLVVDLVLTGASTKNKPVEKRPKETKVNLTKVFDPAFSGSLLAVADTGELYQGLNFQLNLLELVTSTEVKEMPMYFGLYFDIGLAKEQQSTVAEKSMITWALGLNLSFESQKNPARNFLIPYYGVKAGGISITNAGSGFYLEPLVGVSLLQFEAVGLNLSAGAFLNSVNLAKYLGVHSGLTVSLSL